MNKNVVIILGAGSSKDFGMPLANEIFSQACKVLERKKALGGYEALEKAIQDVDEIIRLFYTNLPTDKKDYPPLEEVLTTIWRFIYNSPNEAKHERNFFKPLVDMLGLALAGSHPSPFTDKADYINKTLKCDDYFKALLATGDNIAFISLNYDVIIDTILNSFIDMDKIIHDYTYRYRPLLNLTNGEECRKDGVMLLKPHGSLNLSFCPKCEQIFYFSDNIFTSIVHKREMATCFFCRDEGKKIPVEPLIIPPLYAKEEFINRERPVTDSSGRCVVTTQDKQVVVQTVYKKYRDLIDASMINLLKSADEIIIIGYSLPPYDFDFRILLLRGLMENKNRKNLPIKIITFNGDQDKQLHRYKHLAGDVKIVGEHGFYNYIAEYLSGHSA